MVRHHERGRERETIVKELLTLLFSVDANDLRICSHIQYVFFIIMVIVFYDVRQSFGLEACTTFSRVQGTLSYQHTHLRIRWNKFSTHMPVIIHLKSL